jgi:hypothetical protein
MVTKEATEEFKRKVGDTLEAVEGLKTYRKPL